MLGTQASDEDSTWTERKKKEEKIDEEYPEISKVACCSYLRQIFYRYKLLGEERY